MKIIIQKFGGTSLQTQDLRLLAARQVEDAIIKGFSPVVVVSAMGRHGDAYATDSLLEFARKESAAIVPREKDLLLSCGEIISAVTFAQTLLKLGIQAVALTGFQAGILTDGNFGNAKVKKVFTARLLSIINADKVPIVCGFQGIDQNGEITTLGRGGSDTTASVLGVALQAEEIRIYTDVQGLKTADPHYISSASEIKEASYEEAVELAYKGATVIHPRAVEIASEGNIPLHILSAGSKQNGTMVKNIEFDKPVTGISSKRDLTFVRIIPAAINDYNSGIRIFSILAEEAISVDFIDIRPDSINFVIDAEKKIQGVAIFKTNNFVFELNDNFVKISVVGAGMTGQPGIMAKIVEALHHQNITIRECTDSRTTISCLIDKNSEQQALQALHQKFELGKK